MYGKRCTYGLRGLADTRCPECGRAFDCDDPSIFLTARGGLAWSDR